MKKKLSFLLISSLLSGVNIANADGTTLYGSVRLAVENTSGFDDNNYTDLIDRATQFGFRGTEDLGNGLFTFYRYEFGVDGDRGSIKTESTSRLSYVGIRTAYGDISLGAQWSPYYNVIGYNDIFNGSYSYGRTYLGPYRLADTLLYTSPDFSGVLSGLHFQIALIANGEEAAGGAANLDDDLDAYNIGIGYTKHGFYAGLTYLSTNGLDDEAGLLGGVVGYSNNIFRIGLAGESGSDYHRDYGFVQTGDDPYNISLAGEYYINDNNIVRATIEYADYDTSGVDVPEDATHFAIAYQYDFSTRTRAWVGYSYFDVDELDDELETVSIGLRTDF